MAKISILQAPTFQRVVEIPRIGGDPVKVSFDFKFLDRDQLAEFMDAEFTFSKEFGAATQEEGTTLKSLTGKTEEFQIEQLQKIVAGWGFDEPFDADNLRALVRTAGTVPDAILTAYKQSYQAAREGN